MEASYRPPQQVLEEIAYRAAAIPFRLLQLVVNGRWILFLAMLSLMLFRPPGSDSFPWDRVAFLAVLAAVALHVATRREPFALLNRVTWPMLSLLLLSSCNVLCQGYNAENWSMFAAKWLVPFTVYQIACYAFSDPRARKGLEIYALLVLAYLSFISIAFLAGLHWAVFPSYILDENIGIHADRARGPFLQAVANGMALNLLGLIAIDCLRRKTLRGLSAALLLGGLPIAILATKTRAIWLSFAASMLIVIFSKSGHLRIPRRFLVIGILAVAVLACVYQGSITERLEDRSPVEFRIAMYQAGWQMFLEKPALGWGQSSMKDELGRRISEFHQEAFYFHNTYLEILVEHGLIGLGLYLWMAVALFRLARRRSNLAWVGFPDRHFRTIWPIMLAVYFVNACFVGMNYQFVNVFLFTIAGLLAAQARTEDRIARAL